MSVPILGVNDCSACKHAHKLPAGEIECREGPPTPYPLLQPGPTPGSVNIAGQVALFPIVRAGLSCSRFVRGVHQAN